jgi:hypothetical protein
VGLSHDAALLPILDLSLSKAKGRDLSTLRKEAMTCAIIFFPRHAHAHDFILFEISFIDW